MMKKSEWISLIVFISSVCLFLLALQFDYGGWRTFLGFFSLFVFILSMGGWKKQEQGLNRVEKVLIILLFSALAITNLYALIYCGFTDSHDGWIYISFLTVLFLTGGWFAMYCLYGNGWLNQRVNWLGGDFPPSKKEGKGSSVVRRSTSIDKNTTCLYLPKQRLFKVLRRLYTAPQHHDEECKERISKLRTQLAKIGIEIDLMTCTDESPFYFDVEIGIARSTANKKNVCKIGGILTALSEEDPYIYYHLDVDNKTRKMYVLRNRVVMTEFYETHCPQELLNKMLSGEGKNEIIIKDVHIYTKEEFETLMRWIEWDEDDVGIDDWSDLPNKDDR